MDFSKFDIFNKRATIVVDNKYRAFVVTGSRKDKHGKIIFDCRTIDAHPQQRVLEVKIFYCCWSWCTTCYAHHNMDNIWYSRLADSCWAW